MCVRAVGKRNDRRDTEVGEHYNLPKIGLARLSQPSVS